MHFIAVNAPPLGIRKNPNACSNISVRAPNFFLTPFRHYHTPWRICAFKMRAQRRAQVRVTFLYGATIPHRAACYIWLDKSSGARKKNNSARAHDFSTLHLAFKPSLRHVRARSAHKKFSPTSRRAHPGFTRDAKFAKKSAFCAQCALCLHMADARSGRVLRAEIAYIA